MSATPADPNAGTSGFVPRPQVQNAPTSTPAELPAQIMLQLTFYWGKHLQLLFDGWATKSLVYYCLSLVVVLIFAVFYELIVSVRLHLSEQLAMTYHDDRFKATNSIVLALRDTPRVSQAVITILYGVSAACGYLLILMVISFNAGVIIVAVLGLMLGFFIFRKPTIADNPTRATHV